jgi:hypothetical protein
MRWYWETEKGTQGAAKLRETFATLSLRLDRENESASVTGVLPITADTGYTVILDLPPNYPVGVPTLWINRKEIPWIPDRHVNQTTGEACLCVKSEYRLHWPHRSDICVFIDRLVRPYFAAQFFYDTYRFWPKDGARSHGKDGIVEAYRELSAPFGDDSMQTIKRLMRLLARKGDPKGHELCPCGRGVRLRKCHFEAFRRLRGNIAAEHAEADLRMLFPNQS